MFSSLNSVTLTKIATFLGKDRVESDDSVIVVLQYTARQRYAQLWRNKGVDCDVSVVVVLQ